MRRFKFIIVLSMIVCSLCGCKFSRVEDVSKSEVEIVAGLETAPSVDGNTTSKHEFVFENQKVTSKPGIGSKAKYVEQVYLYLDDSIYYPVDLPDDLDYVSDNSKYIYATDGSVSVSVVSNLDIYEFSEAAFIENAETLGRNLVVSKSGVKGPQEAAIHIVNDKAIIVRCYNNPDAYETILYGLQHNIYYTSTYNNVVKAEFITEELEKLPIYLNYHMTVTAGLGDDIQKIYTFDSGTLTICRELRQFTDACTRLGTKLAVVAGDNTAEKIFESGTVYYVEIGDYTLGVYNINYNTCFTLFGSGEEARYNIVEFLKAQEE